MPAPKQRVKQEERLLRSLELFQKSKALFDREKAMRQLRDARSQAEALEHYLATLNPAYRQAAAAPQRRTEFQQLADLVFRGRTAPEEVLPSTPPTTADFARP